MDKIYLLPHSGSAHSLSSDTLARHRFKEARIITSNWICLNSFSSLILIHVSSWLHQDWVNRSLGACAEAVLPTHWQLSSLRRPVRSQGWQDYMSCLLVILIRTLIFLLDSVKHNDNDPVTSLIDWKLARFPLNNDTFNPHLDFAKTTNTSIFRRPNPMYLIQIITALININISSFCWRLLWTLCLKLGSIFQVT